jgi:hypothetical protein
MYYQIADNSLLHDGGHLFVAARSSEHVFPAPPTVRPPVSLGSSMEQHTKQNAPASTAGHSFSSCGRNPHPTRRRWRRTMRLQQHKNKKHRLSDRYHATIARETQRPHAARDRARSGAKGDAQAARVRPSPDPPHPAAVAQSAHAPQPWRRHMPHCVPTTFSHSKSAMPTPHASIQITTQHEEPTGV